MRRVVMLSLIVVATATSCGRDKQDVRTSDDATPTTVEQRSWTYSDESGVSRTILDDDDTDFIGGVPEPVALMSALNDCDAVHRETDYWRTQTQRNDYSEQYRANASAYTAFGADRLRALGCP